MPTPTKPMVSIDVSSCVFSYVTSTDWSEKFTFTPNEPSITVHSRTSKVRSPLTKNGSAFGDRAGLVGVAARRMVRPSPRRRSAAVGSGPEANTTPRFSRPIMYSRCAARYGCIFSGATAGFDSTT